MDRELQDFADRRRPGMPERAKPRGTIVLGNSGHPRFDLGTEFSGSFCPELTVNDSKVQTQGGS